MNAMIFILHLAVVMWIIYRSRFFHLKGFPIAISYALFLLKCICGILIYRYYSGLPEKGDTVLYFKEAEIIFRLLINDPVRTFQLLLDGAELPAGNGIDKLLWNEPRYMPFANDVHTIIIFNVILRFFSLGNFAVHILWFNVVAFAGICCMHNSFNGNGQSHKTNLIPYLFPQFLIWTSAILKEPLMMLGFGLTIAGIAGIYRHNTHSWWVLICGILLFLVIKTFLFLLFLPALIAMLLIYYNRKRHIILIYASVFAILFAALWLAGSMNKSYHLPSVLSSHQLSMYRFAVYSHAGSVLEPVTLAPSWMSFFKRIPESVAYAFMQPLPWKYTFTLAWPVFIENVLILIAFLSGVYHRKKRLLENPVRFGLLITGILFLITAGFTTPVAGSLIRYKLPGILFMLLAVWLPGMATGKKVKREH